MVAEALGRWVCVASALIVATMLALLIPTGADARHRASCDSARTTGTNAGGPRDRRIDGRRGRAAFKNRGDRRGRRADRRRRHRSCEPRPPRVETPTVEETPTPGDGTTPPDGGATTPPDGGATTPPDGGSPTPPPDHGGSPPGGGATPPSGGSCSPTQQQLADLIASGMPGCATLLNDPASNPDALSIWGRYDCQTSSRHQLISGGADTHPLATGSAHGNDSFRRLTVVDGDDFYGERCELGYNNWERGPTTLYHEGERRITYFSLRLPNNYPLSSTRWQVVMQMKQTHPADGGDGAPIIELDAKGGRWRLINSWNEVWSVPAQLNRWTRFAFDMRYSQDPGKASMKVYVDLNGDGDSADANEQSPTFNVPTLKREISGTSSDGLDAGESIPSHLRLGPYHDPAISCPSSSPCAVDVDNVQVFGVP
jgi:Polysaccharide lyase